MYDEVVSYLNEKAGTNYRSSTPKTQSLIRARVSEGFTVEDFKVVIDKKCTEWTGTDMEKYLRPETLFGSKFESYLNAKATKSSLRLRVSLTGIRMTSTNFSEKRRSGSDGNV